MASLSPVLVLSAHPISQLGCRFTAEFPGFQCSMTEWVIFISLNYSAFNRLTHLIQTTDQLVVLLDASSATQKDNCSLVRTIHTKMLHILRIESDTPTPHQQITHFGSILARASRLLVFNVLYLKGFLMDPKIMVKIGRRRSKVDLVSCII
jgi:hypothetical protein